MTRPVLVLAVTFSLLGAPAAAQPAAQPGCGQHTTRDAFVKRLAHVYRYAVGGYGGDYTARPRVPGRNRVALGRMVRCSSTGKLRKVRKAKVQREREAWLFYRHFDRITVYGESSVPPGIPACESGNDYHYPPGAYPLGGYYGIIPSSWANAIYNPYYRGWPTASDAPPYAQHDVAARIWAMEGQSAWACQA